MIFKMVQAIGWSFPYKLHQVMCDRNVLRLASKHFQPASNCLHCIQHSFSPINALSLDISFADSEKPLSAFAVLWAKWSATLIMPARFGYLCFQYESSRHSKFIEYSPTLVAATKPGSLSSCLSFHLSSKTSYLDVPTCNFVAMKQTFSNYSLLFSLQDESIWSCSGAWQGHF